MSSLLKTSDGGEQKKRENVGDTHKIIKKYLGPIDEFILEEIINILNSWKKFLH